MRIAVFWGGEHTLPGNCSSEVWYSFYNSGWKYGFESLGHDIDYFPWSDCGDHAGYDLYVYAPGFLTNTTFHKNLHHPNVFFTEEAAVATSWAIAHSYYYDNVASLDYVNVIALAANGIKNIHWVPGAVDPTIFYDKTVVGHEGKGWDVAFLGTYDNSVVINNGMTLLDYVKAIDSRIPKALVATGFYSSSANDIWNASKIGIDVPIVEFCSFRLFQIIAAGTFAVTRKSRVPTGLDLLLEPEHYATYEDAEDLISNVIPKLLGERTWWTATPCAQKYVLEKHTFKNRAEQLLKIARLI